MTRKIRPRLRSRTLIFAGCGAVLVWLVVSHSLAAYFAEAAPRSALWLSPRQPEALVNLADRSINLSVPQYGTPADLADQGPDPQKPGGTVTAPGSVPTDNSSPQQTGTPNRAVNGAGATSDPQNLTDAFAMFGQNQSVDLAELRDEVGTALMNDPLNARALRIMGQIGEAGRDDGSAAKFMAAAAHLSLQETVAVYWLMRQSARARDYQSAIADADVLLRTHPALAAYVVPVMAGFADDKDAIPSVEAALDNNPPWRRQFFEVLVSNVTDARTPLKLLMALKNTPTPPTAMEIGYYLSVLLQHKFYSLAYYTWLQFLPLDELRHADLLFNGSFEFPLSTTPFDWKIEQGSGVSIDIVPRPDASDQHALAIEFLYGRVDFHSVTELVVLAPGTYRFSGQYRGNIDGPRGMKWRIVCVDSSTRLGESPMILGISSAWKTTDFTFTVPTTDCRAQYVSLDLDARMASEQLVSGTLLFDNLGISRVIAPPSTAAASVPPTAPRTTAAPSLPAAAK